MSFIDVKNSTDTAGEKPPQRCLSWLDFWEKKKSKKANVCEVLLCVGNPDVGGHVYKQGEEAIEYILPMCNECNNKPEDEIFKAWEGDLVSVK